MGEHGEFGGQEPLIQTIECGICQEEDSIKNLETPCACSGSLKFAHRKFGLHYFDEKEDITCEICHQGWTIAGTPLDLHDHQILAMAAAEHCCLEGEYDEDADTNANEASFCRSATLIIFLLWGLLDFCSHVTYILQGRRQIQEAAARTATEVAFMLQIGQRRGLHFTMVTGSAAIPHQEPLQ